MGETLSRAESGGAGVRSNSISQNPAPKTILVSDSANLPQPGIWKKFSACAELLFQKPISLEMALATPDHRYPK